MISHGERGILHFGIFEFLFVAIPAALIGLAGKAVRYILTGERKGKVENRPHAMSYKPDPEASCHVFATRPLSRSHVAVSAQ